MTSHPRYSVRTLVIGMASSLALAGIADADPVDYVAWATDVAEQIGGPGADPNELFLLRGFRRPIEQFDLVQGSLDGHSFGLLVTEILYVRRWDLPLQLALDGEMTVGSNGISHAAGLAPSTSVVDVRSTIVSALIYAGPIANPTVLLDIDGVVIQARSRDLGAAVTWLIPLVPGMVESSGHVEALSMTSDAGSDAGGLLGEQDDEEWERCGQVEAQASRGLLAALDDAQSNFTDCLVTLGGTGGGILAALKRLASPAGALTALGVVLTCEDRRQDAMDDAFDDYCQAFADASCPAPGECPQEGES